MEYLAGAKNSLLKGSENELRMKNKVNTEVVFQNGVYEKEGIINFPKDIDKLSQSWLYFKLEMK